MQSPLTHAVPKPGDLAIELPLQTKRRLGLDSERSWVVTREFNRFTWPGFDLRPDASGEIVIGMLPGTLVEQIIANVRFHAEAGNVRAPNRD